ncbi:hypothetical protein YC2023_114029 [Brassica napus]
MHVATGGVLSVSTATLLLCMTPWEGSNLAATYRHAEHERGGCMMSFMAKWIRFRFLV